MDIKHNKFLEVAKKAFRNLAIALNMTVYSIYLVFLLFSIIFGLGVLWINIILMLMTAAFMTVYVFLRLSNKKTGRQISWLKQYYKLFKLVAQITTLLIAIYALLTAIDTVSPVLIIFALVGVIFLILRLLIAIILYFIKKQIDHIKDEIAYRVERRRRRKDEDNVDDAMKPLPKEQKKKAARRASSNGGLDEIVIPVEECLLLDVEDL